MPLVNAYATTTQLRNHLVDGGAALSAELLERAINASSRAVENYTGRRFWLDPDATAARTYRAISPMKVFTDDIGSRTGLTVASGYDGTTFDLTWTEGVDYVLEPHNADKTSGIADTFAFWRLVALPVRSFPVYGYPTVKVTARWGWSAVPAEVEEATILMAASLFKRKDAPFGVAGFGEFGVVRIARNDPDVISLLADFVRPKVAG